MTVLWLSLETTSVLFCNALKLYGLPVFNRLNKINPKTDFGLRTRVFLFIIYSNTLGGKLTGYTFPISYKSCSIKSALTCVFLPFATFCFCLFIAVT